MQGRLRVYFVARCLRRALDQKVRKLRTMLTADEDITTELDKIVCRLMKLALRTSRGRRSPPPTRWMQCKLLDLLTLTEKAIERRKRHFIDNYPLKSISYDPSEKSQEMIALEKIRDDDTALKIVDKYRHLVPTEKNGVMEESRAKYSFIDLELEDDLSVTSAEFLKDYEYIDRHSPSLYEPEPTITEMALLDPTDEKTKLERTQAWLEDDLELVPYPNHDMNFDDISSGDTEHSTSLSRYYKKSYKRYKTKKQCIELKCVICKRSHSKCFQKESKKNKKIKDNTSKTKIIKKVSKKKSSYNSLFKDCSDKHVSVDYRHYRVKPRKKEYESLQPTASKPIPASLIKLCHPELMVEDGMETYKEHIVNFTRENHVTQYNQSTADVAATKKSLLIDIVMDDIHETIAMRRTIGTDAEGDPMAFEDETLIRSVSNTIVNDYNFFDKHDVGIDNDDTIFLNDINEPSTSKGIRHVSMDVQCGPDALAPNYSILSATTSVTKLPSIFSAGIKIGDSSTDTKLMNTDCCTLTDDVETYKTIAPRERAVGIKIKESAPNVTFQTESATMTQKHKSFPHENVVILHEEVTTQKQVKTKREQDATTREQAVTMREQGLTVREPEARKQETNIGGLDMTVFKIQQPTIMREQGSTMQEQELIVMQEEESHIVREDSDRTNASSPAHTDFSTETKCLKSITSEIKIKDSSSEFCGSIASIPISPASMANCDLQMVSSFSKDVGVSRKLTRYVRPKLCCGGVQVHSYRDKQTSEDIMYQGEWQNPRPKVLTKRKVFNPVIVKKITDLTLKKRVSSKEKVPAKNFVSRNVQSASKTSSPTRSVDPIKTKTNVEKTNERISTFVPKSVAKVNRPIRPVAKVASKVTMSSATSKNTKSAYIVKKPPITVVSKPKDAQKTTTTINKNYLPYYLRKSALKPIPNDKNILNLSVDSAKTNICMKINARKPLERSKTEEIKRDLLKFQNKVPEANYVVLRNDVEKNGSANDGQPPKTTESGRRRSTAAKRPISPQSQNSSTCSSPNSIATVRAVSIRPKNASSRRHSNSSHKTSTANSGSENTTPNRNKKFTKRCKSAKMSDDKTFDNKENIPQTSKQSNLSIRGSDKIAKGTFLGQKKEVFIAHLKETPPLQLPTNKKPKSNVNVPKTTSTVEKSSPSPTVSKKSSLKSDDWTNDNQNTMSASTEISNIVLLVEPQKQFDSPIDTPNIINSRLITEWMDNSSLNADVSETSNILSAMRMLIEETLDFIDVPYDNNRSIDSETVILSREDYNTSVDLSASPISFRTVITNENNSLQSELEHALNRSFDTTLGDESILSLNDTRFTVTDFDLLSFKSINSEYLSAGSSQGKLPATMQSVHTNSVKDIYERKDLPFTCIPQNNAGAIAIQAFSGFSINGEPVAGDKPDAINIIDSETGSMAVDVSRQANSEELFISGRSSDTFESCLIDEDAVVPSWLFQIISQQQAAEGEINPPEPLLNPLPMPDDPMYDDNGNVVEGIGLGAGAGDGRGMHSDQSQDSSGRGTSLSSSATSSGAQSEAILIDPSAYEAQYEDVALLQDSEDSSIVMVGINDGNNELGHAQGAGPIAPDSQSFSHGESSRRNPRVQVTTASDVDADVSSLETDVPDSSDN